MEMHDVASSHIEKIGHDGNDVMEIRFKGNRRYKYSGVSAADFSGLKGAESQGTYLRQMGAVGEKIEETDED